MTPHVPSVSKLPVLELQLTGDEGSPSRRFVSHSLLGLSVPELARRSTLTLQK